MSQRKGLDIKSAGYKLADQLKNYQELGLFETAISNAKQQLNMLNFALEDQKAALGVIIDLRKSGMGENEISNLTKIVNGWANGNGNGFKLDTSINGNNRRG